MATLTSFLKLYKPVTNEIGWDDNMNSNLDIVDGFVNQFMAVPGFVGAWVNSHAYVIGNIALDINTGSFYRCAAANTSAATGTFAADRTAHPGFWTLSNNAAQDAATAAAASAAAAASSATTSATNATAAANSAASSAASLTTFQNIYYGSFATDPLTDPHGGARTAGDMYFNTTTQRLRVWGGSSWIEITPTLSTFTEAPSAPLGAVWLRTGTQAWVQGIAQSGGTFTGSVGFQQDVILGSRLGTGRVPPANMVGGSALSDATNAAFILALNLYQDPTGTWHYITAVTPSSSTGAAVITSTVDAATTRVIHFHTTARGEVSTVGGTAVPVTVMEVNSDSNLTIFGPTGAKSGGGLWAAISSDVRTKNVIGPYPHGLTELLEMLPKLYTYKGNAYSIDPETGGPGVQLNPDTTTQHIGLIAQDCEPYMPELVTQTSAYIDGELVNDMRQLDASGVIYALVNAVAELVYKTRSPDVVSDYSKDVDIQTGNETGPANNYQSGYLFLHTGTSTNGYSSDASLYSGDAKRSTGNVNIRTGNSETENGGSIIITVGNTAAGSPAPAGNVVLVGVPTVDPHYDGAIWCDVTAGRVLKLSAG